MTDTGWKMRENRLRKFKHVESGNNNETVKKMGEIRG